MADMTRSTGGGSQNLYLSGTWIVLVNGSTVYNKTDGSRGACATYSEQVFDVMSGDTVTVQLRASGDRGDNGSYYGSTTQCKVYFRLN